MKMEINNFHRRDEVRALNEVQAAEYIGMSISFLRKDRMNGTLMHRTPGPHFAKVGKRVLYLKEDLDQWLEYFKVVRR